MFFYIFYYLYYLVAIIFIKFKILLSFNLLTIKKIYLIDTLTFIFYKIFFSNFNNYNFLTFYPFFIKNFYRDVIAKISNIA